MTEKVVLPEPWGTELKLLTALAVAPFVVVLGASSLAAESLRDAVRFAVTTNPSVRATESDMRAAAYELMQLRREYLPQVYLDAQVGYQRVDDPSSLSVADNDSTKASNSIGVRAELLLFDGYRRSNLVYANAARVDGSIFRLLDASETMALNATEAYIDVYRHRVLLQVAKRNVAKHEEIGRRVKDLVEGGRLPFSDELTIDDRIRSAKLAQLDVERSLRDANARYERIVGRSPTGGMSIPRAPVPGSLNAFTAEAIERSYRVQFAQTQIEQSRFEADAILADRLPRVTLNAGVSREKNRNGVSGYRTDETVGVGLRWTLYQGGRKAEENALAEMTSKAMAQQTIAVRDVTELAARTWNVYTTNLDRANQLQEQLRINRLIVEVYGDEFDAAKRTLLDLLEVERARFNVEFESVGAQAGLVFASYRTLAARSKLANHFGLTQANLALDPNFRARAQVNPTNVFNTTIEPLQ